MQMYDHCQTLLQNDDIMLLCKSLERSGVWCSVSVHVDDDASRWNGRRSAAEEENLIDDECQKAGKCCR